jgi:hypothetical protein
VTFLGFHMDLALLAITFIGMMVMALIYDSWMEADEDCLNTNRSNNDDRIQN